MTNIFLIPHIKFVFGVRKSFIINLKTSDVEILSKEYIEATANKININFPEVLINESIRKSLEIAIATDKNISFVSNGYVETVLENEIIDTKVCEIAEIEISQFFLQNYQNIFSKCIDIGVNTFIFLVRRNSFDLALESLPAFDDLNISYNLLMIDLDDNNYIYNSLIKLVQLKNVNKIFFKSDSNQLEQIKNYRIVRLDQYSKIKFKKNIFNVSKFAHPYFYSRIYINNSGNYSNSYKDINFGGKFLIDDIDLIFKSLLSRFWFIKRDTINSCKFCEFRYSCLDNEIPIIVKGSYYLSKKCNFSPNEN